MSITAPATTIAAVTRRFASRSARAILVVLVIVTPPLSPLLALHAWLAIHN
jgi:hypothetical protein